MDGAFPDLVRKGLPGNIKSGIATPSSAKAEFDEKAPEPSPIDFDWRFDECTASRLAEMLIGESNRRVLSPALEAAPRGGFVFIFRGSR
jgi:hypothetical protein